MVNGEIHRDPNAIASTQRQESQEMAATGYSLGSIGTPPTEVLRQVQLALIFRAYY